MSSETTAKAIVKFVAEETGISLTYERMQNGDIIARDAQGRLNVIICYSFNSGEYIVRGLVRMRRRGCRYGWLCNGQAGTNMVQVHHWGEEHRYRLSIEEWIAELDARFPRSNWLKILGTGALPIPSHLNENDVGRSAAAANN